MHYLKFNAQIKIHIRYLDSLLDLLFTIKLKPTYMVKNSTLSLKLATFLKTEQLLKVHVDRNVIV